MFLSTDQSSEQAKWSGKYGSLAIAFCNLITCITSWGENWILTVLLGMGVLVCGTMGIFDLKQHIKG
ncbi:hypothetical protein KYJ26_11005 [Bacillus sp. MCCB 382]|nr:hypothetical protein [Bacillus sp. MCCB 382]